MTAYTIDYGATYSLSGFSEDATAALDISIPAMVYGAYDNNDDDISYYTPGVPLDWMDMLRDQLSVIIPPLLTAYIQDMLTIPYGENYYMELVMAGTGSDITFHANDPAALYGDWFELKMVARHTEYHLDVDGLPVIDHVIIQYPEQ